LEANFAVNNFITTTQRNELAKKCKLRSDQVNMGENEIKNGIGICRSKFGSKIVDTNRWKIEGRVIEGGIRLFQKKKNKDIEFMAKRAADREGQLPRLVRLRNKDY
jgi:hypothetical protein